MHTIPRFDLRALYLALALAALANAALYAAFRLWGLEAANAGLAGMGAAGLLAIGVYRGVACQPLWVPPEAAPATKKKRSRKDAPSVAKVKIDPAWLMRAATLLAGAMLLQLGVRHLALPDPTWPAWRAETTGFVFGLFTSVCLLGWGARFWLQSQCRDTPEPISPGLQRVRDYLPGAACFLGACLMLWVRVPALFQGEMSSDTAQGLFWAAYEKGPWHFDGEGIAWLPKAVAYALHGWSSPATSVPHIYQGVACLLLAACTSAFAWPVFRQLLVSDLARVLICAALACQPDYMLKTLAHVGAYSSVPILLLTWLVLCTPAPTVGAALGAGIAVSVLALSHPGGAAFAFVLALLLAVSAWRKSLAKAAFCAVAMVGPCMQAWAQALLHRAASGGVADAGGQTTLVAKYVAMLPLWGVGGKIALSLNAGDDGAYVFWLCAAAAAIACLVQVAIAPERRVLWVMALIAAITAATAVACHVLLAPEAAAAFWTSGNLVGLAAPAWFIPCVTIFMALAVAIGGSTLNKHVPWALALWLFAGYPFGLGQLPRAPLWPVHGFSAWQALAPHVLSQSPPRGCIPVDPFPTYLGMDCHLLHSVGSATGLGGWMTFFNEVPLQAPEPAATWSVDSIGIAFNKTPPLDAPPWHIPATLAAMDAEGKEITRAEATFHPPEIFTHFIFPKPLEHVAGLKLIITPNTSLAVGIESQETREPFWVWFGRGQPEEGGEGVHLAGQP